jgi:hypothetical protein
MKEEPKSEMPLKKFESQPHLLQSAYFTKLKISPEKGKLSLHDKANK